MPRSPEVSVHYTPVPGVSLVRGAIHGHTMIVPSSSALATR